MNITHENTDALNALLTIEVEQKDYEPKVEQSLKDYRKKAVIKGFRPGKAPASLINKMYKKSAVVEEVHKIISENIYQYIKEKEITILGEPLPSENQETIDWENQNDFKFQFDLALAPEFEVKLSKRDKVPYYSIKIDKEMRNGYIDSILGRHGEYIPAEQADNDSLVKATLTELNPDESPKEDGVTIEDGMISVMLVANEDEKKNLIGAKEGDVMIIDVTKAFPNETDRSALLKVKKEELATLEPLFQATITEVKQYVKAEVNQALYDKLFGEGNVTTEEEFHQKIDEGIKQNLKGDTERKFYTDVRDKLIDKFKIELPKEFLVRWLTAINEGKYTQEQIESEFPMFEKDLKWQLVRDKIANEQEMKVEEEELKNMARGYIMNQMMQYGMGQLPDEFIDKYANDIITKDEERKKMAERVIETKVIDWLKETVKLDEKEIEFEKFKELMNA